MSYRPLKQLCGFIATAAVALVLIGCNGKTGAAGLNGTNGTNGSNGTNGTNGTNAVVTVNAAQLTADQWSQLTLNGTVTSVTMGAKPVVNFTVTDGKGTPVSGLGYTTKAANALAPSYSAFGFSIAKLVPGANGSPSKWVNYIVTTMPNATTAAAPSKPSTDNTGTLVDNGDGSYKYTFYRDITATQAFLDGYAYDATKNQVRTDLGDVSYQANLTHRISIQIGGNARGTSTNTADGSNSGVTGVPILTPANILYDFVPATGAAPAADAQRNIVDTASCNSCHTRFEVHGGNRIKAEYCVVCHTDQRKYGNAEAATTATGYTGNTYKINGLAVGDFPAFIHRLHAGEELNKTGYLYAGINFNETTYPQDLRNCSKCHTASIAATPQGEAWNTNPSRMACGACHDGIDWVAGTNHLGGPQTSDLNCTSCHGSAGVKLVHIPATPPNPAFATGGYTNGAYISAYTSNLPAGAIKVTWDLKSVTLNASAQPVFEFRFLQDGQRADFNVLGSGKTELWDNFVGAPSVYMAFAVPQDGIAKPADWNATVSGYIKKIWNGTATGAGAGTLTGPDANGYYKVTLTGVQIPATATMITGGIGYTYNKNTQSITQTNVAGYVYDPVTMMGGLSVPPPNVTKPMSGTLPAGFAAQASRRTIVSTAKCNDCHQALGVFTKEAYHAGERNDAASCIWCHNSNKVNNGWSVNAKEAIHGLHAASKRVNKFSWYSKSFRMWEPTYPGILNNCEACHVPGSYDFSNSANAAAIPSMLPSTSAAGDYTKDVDGATVLPAGSPLPVIKTGAEPYGNYYSPFVSWGSYGTYFSFNAATGVTTPAASTTLINSPITSACSACHDSAAAIAHFKGNGGAFYEPRATGLLKVEQCMVCHGSGRTADIKAVHMNFK